MSIRQLLRRVLKNVSVGATRRSRKRDWTAAIVEGLEPRTLLSAFTEFADPNPSPGNRFGDTVLALSTGNVVITSPFDDAGGNNAGAVYLFNGSTGELISTLTGSHADDNIGHDGVTALSNGNFVIISANWDNGGATDAGAATWGSGTTGVSGIVSAANSLVGSRAFDQVGIVGVTALTNGNYVVSSPNWATATDSMVGAATWGNGATGVTGEVTTLNSLTGIQSGDQVGQSVTALVNGNYVVCSPDWDNGIVNDTGAVTWGNGTTGITGEVSSLNSLVGEYETDYVGLDDCITALSNGHYVVSTPTMHRLVEGNLLPDVGAVTWGNGMTGITGGINASNSLLGSTAFDSVGNVVALTNGNYVVATPDWDNFELASNNLLAEDVGAVTWGNGSTGTVGLVSSANSLVGSYFEDWVGIGGVTALTNGNYVVSSSFWGNGGPVSGIGAVTWANGTTGLIGVVSPSNSLIGSQTGDNVGDGGVIALSNGNYVVLSPYWNNGDVYHVGAATWGNGDTGTTGVVGTSNSIYGGHANDRISSFGATALANGNYVVISPEWNNGSAEYVGAVTWANGTSVTSALVTESNSLIGSQPNDYVGGMGVTPLSNGNYVVSSPYWNEHVGAVTWGSGTTGVTGPVSATNSLVGSTDEDHIGDYGSVQELDNGDYVVSSVDWDNGASEDSGAVTLGSGTAGITGTVSAVNSTIGQSSNSWLDIDVVSDPVNGNYFISFLKEGGGRVLVRPQLFVPPPPVNFMVTGSTLVVTGSADSDTITVLNDAGVIKIHANGVIIDTGLGVGSVTAVTISGQGGSDLLKLDASLGALVVGTLLGGAGNDTLISGLGDDTLDGGADTDTVSYIQATTGVRVSLALATVQTTVGAGKDKLLAVENLTGSSWNDTLTGNGGNNVLAGGLGNDMLSGGLGADSLYGEGDNDSLTIDGDDLFVSGGQGNDKVTVASGSGSVVLDLTAGQIETVVATASTVGNAFDASGATWVVSITGGSGNDTIIGGTLNDRLVGGSGDDLISGGEGNDSINGGLGNDTIYGQDGNDTLNGDAGADELHGNIGDDSLTIDGDDQNATGDEGNDKVTVAAGSGNVHLYLASGAIETVIATASTANNTFNAVGATWSVSITGGSGDDAISGGDAADKLTGGGGDDSLNGGGGGDSLVGGDGDDWIFGGNGNDSLNGGLGADKLFGDAGNDSLTIDGDDTHVVGDEGFDKVTVAAGSGAVILTLGSNSIESVVATASTADNWFMTDDATFAVSIIGGSGNDVIAGGSFNDTLSGGGGDDFIVGGGGNDIMIGGLGADRFYGGEGNDSLTIDNLDTDVRGEEGLDKVTVSGATGGVTLNLTDGAIETVLATASTYANTFDAEGATWAVSITGGSGNDTIIGGNLNDTLTGGAGNDRIEGFGGNDLLIGGLGADTLNGGNDNDSLMIDNLDTHVIGGAGLDKVTVSGATGGVTLNLTDGEIETVLATASTYANTFDATGATWAVSITGGSGNDTIIGGNLNDTLTGGAGDDSISGGEGDDALTGGLGADKLLGNGGNDALKFDNLDTSVNGGAGLDTATVTAPTGAVSLNLFTGEIETVSATTSTFHNLFDATGATWNVAITGGSGNDTLRGGLMNDKLTGGAGNDLLIGGDGNDTITGGDGIDTISYETASGPVTVNLATKKATGAAGNDFLATIENVIGSPFNDTITGDLLSNILNGGDGILGNDTITGGGGIDSIINA